MSKKMIKSNKLETSENLLDVLLRTQAHQIEELKKSNLTIAKIREELEGKGGTLLEDEM